MAIVRTDDTHYAAIAEALRQNLGSTAKFTPAQMPAGVADVFEAGKAAGGGSSGGGLPSGVTALTSGTYTSISPVSAQFGIEHGLGVTPNFFFIYAEGESLDYTAFSYYIASEFGLRQSFTTSITPGQSFRIYRYGSNGGFTQTVSVAQKSSFSDESAFCVYCSSTYNLKAGVTYRWIAGVVDGI